MAPETFFLAGALVMWVGTAAFLWIRQVDETHQVYHTIVMLVGLVAALAYTSMALGIGIVSLGGKEIYLGRYVQWILGTPLIVLYLGMLAGTGSDWLAALIAVDVLAMVAALAAALVTGPARLAMFVVGSVLYVVLLYGLLSTLADAADGRHAAVTALFRKLRNLTVVTWTFYPVVWALGPLLVGVLDPVGEILIVTYLDVVAKVLFGFIAVNSRVALDRMPEIDSLSAWQEVLA